MMMLEQEERERERRKEEAGRACRRCTCEGRIEETESGAHSINLAQQWVIDIERIKQELYAKRRGGKTVITHIIRNEISATVTATN